MARLNTHVHVDGTWYGPGDMLPDDVAGRITNPDVWDGPAPAKSVPEGTATGTQSRDSGDGTVVKQPPRRGPGSGGPAWIEHAARLGVTEKFDSKDALIAHLEDAGLIEKE